ncbi:MAG: DEAD/DEAH box helicase [Deltaproteobacteria bacterium]
MSTNEPLNPEAVPGFESFDLHVSLQKGLTEAGFVTPRAIQSDTIPAGLEGRDVLGLAQTGTGKTAAFALPILQRRVQHQGKGPLALILAPTRELANQIDTEIRLLAKFTRIRTVTVYGGKSIRMQAEALRRSPEIVVGCPGRVLDLLKQGVLDLSRIEQVVIDEADHMFDMGFLPDVKRILGATPEKRQNLLFSATMPKEIRLLADRILYNPQVVELAHSAPADRIEHALCPVPAEQKRDLLDRMLAEEDCRTAIIFTRTKHRARHMATKLAKEGHSAVALQGNMSQAQRDRAMEGFRRGKYDILVATDIAARGLDVAGVSYVINFDPPSTPENYTHRIGRTGRSDESGKARTFVTREDAEWVRDTERYLGAEIERMFFEGFDDEPIVVSRSAMKSKKKAASREGVRQSQSQGRGNSGQARRDERSGGQRSGAGAGGSGRRYGASSEGGGERRRDGASNEGGRRRDGAGNEGERRRYGSGNESGGERRRYGASSEGGGERRRYGASSEGGGERRRYGSGSQGNARAHHTPDGRGAGGGSRHSAGRGRTGGSGSGGRGRS